WIVTVAASVDRRRVVSFESLESSLTRHVVKKLARDTQYFVFLDSVDHNDWYLTMIATPIAIRTLAKEAPVTKTTTKQTERTIGRGDIKGGNENHRTTSPSWRSTTEWRREGRGTARSSTTERTRQNKSGSIPEGTDDSGRRVIITKVKTTVSPTKSTTDRANVVRRHGSNSGRRMPWATKIPVGDKGREIETDRVDERRKVMNRKTLATQSPERPTLMPRAFSNRTNTGRNYRTTAKPRRISNSLKVTAVELSTVGLRVDFIDTGDKIRNRSGAGVDSTEKQLEAKDRTDAGSRVLWWVLVTSFSSGILFLALTMLVVCTRQCRSRSKAVSCPHMEQELSQTSKSGVATSGTKANTRTVAENGYIRSMSVSSARSRPLPPVSVSISASGNQGSACAGERGFTGSDEDHRSEENIYATVGSDLLTLDPTRVVSIISWGSEFDILEESKGTTYSNVTGRGKPQNEYGNLEMTYGNMASTQAASTSQQTSSGGTPSAATPPLPVRDFEKLPSPHPYAVPRRQTSVSSVPNFLAPPLPPLSPTISAELFPHSHSQTPSQPTVSKLAQQQQQQQPMSPLLVQPQQQQHQIAPLPGLDLPKEQLQQLVMLLLSNQTGSRGDSGEGIPTSSGVDVSSTSSSGISDQPLSPVYLLPGQPSARKP
ncbi:hypothetical protein EGW08_019968, partial [Elysia chlorotica]